MDALIIALDVLIGSAWVVGPILATKYGTMEPEPQKPVDGWYQINRKSFEFARTQL